MSPPASVYKIEVVAPSVAIQAAWVSIMKPIEKYATLKASFDTN